MPAGKLFLRGLGLFGLDALEARLLAGLPTRDPILLIGPHGCARTLLGQLLARALGCRFHRYDAFNAMFEDLLGFPTSRVGSKPVSPTEHNPFSPLVELTGGHRGKDQRWWEIPVSAP